MIGFLSRKLPDPIVKGLTAAFFRLSAWQSSGMHSQSKVLDLEGVRVIALPALQDNYMYLVVDKVRKEAAVIDPVEPETVIDAVKNEDVTLKAILTTHHHWDHSGGNNKLVERVPGLFVYGGDDRVDALTHQVADGDRIQLGAFNFDVISTPCHTKGHLCYYIQPDSNSGAVFTGDTLFIAGCGKFFEGTADQMYKALVEKLATLPTNTNVFCGHEYTVTNLKFANHVESNNDAIKEKLSWAKEQRKQDQPTIPSTIGEELATNPFMRVKEKPLQEFANSSDPVTTMGFLRKKKDNFKPEAD
ncbi:hydroxyacylglutathione hydrolase, mitochondrial [Nilaparvata lugens]|uniref:hydroxyacylglutathione hydrolase, mitochondrial n=1 Tax=Nilaparvata lugens TaxID=108931 RepID=UPI000B98C4BE|nr:hydroxyacylglutathione hydrolase, mitochondrial [Nilaparvata lugens]